jgi:hypothetical protein
MDSSFRKVKSLGTFEDAANILTNLELDISIIRSVRFVVISGGTYRAGGLAYKLYSKANI